MGLRNTFYKNSQKRKSRKKEHFPRKSKKTVGKWCWFFWMEKW